MFITNTMLSYSLFATGCSRRRGDVYFVLACLARKAAMSCSAFLAMRLARAAGHEQGAVVSAHREHEMGAYMAERHAGGMGRAWCTMRRDSGNT